MSAAADLQQLKHANDFVLGNILATCRPPALPTVGSCKESDTLSAAQESMLQEAAELSQASFGPTILGAIGRTYLLCGEAASGNLLQGPWASLRQTGQGVKSKVHAARLALKVTL